MTTTLSAHGYSSAKRDYVFAFSSRDSVHQRVPPASTKSWLKKMLCSLLNNSLATAALKIGNFQELLGLPSGWRRSKLLRLIWRGFFDRKAHHFIWIVLKGEKWHVYFCNFGLKLRLFSAILNTLFRSGYGSLKFTKKMSYYNWGKMWFQGDSQKVGMLMTWQNDFFKL